jgi:hypothetical protein
MNSLVDFGEVAMKLLTAVMFVGLLATGPAGCKKGADPVFAPDNQASQASSQPQASEAAIRTAIQMHLAQRGTLNLQAFDMDVTQVTIQGDRAQAQVDFRVKGGPGTMQLTYQLERREGNWTVIDSNPQGSNFSHPSLDAGQNPPAGAQAGGSGHSLADTLRSFKSGDGAGSTSLPSGHPPIAQPSGSTAP